MVLRRTHSYISNVHLSPSLARLICETKGPLRVTARLPTKALILPLGSATCRGSFQEPTSACRRWTLQSGRSGFGQTKPSAERPLISPAGPKQTGNSPPTADLRCVSQKNLQQNWALEDCALLLRKSGALRSYITRSLAAYQQPESRRAASSIPYTGHERITFCSRIVGRLS
jgi:hypothetical protein